MSKPKVKPLNPTLITLAARAVEAEIEINFGQGSDYQAELFLSWETGVFHARLTVYSAPITIYGSWYDAPETTWHEQVDTFEAAKIKAVADWLKMDWGFGLDSN
jgi:hypothetical protein